MVDALPDRSQLVPEGADRSSAALTQAAILGQLAEGVIVTDACGRITLVNEAAASMHGVARLDVEPSAYSRTYSLFTEAGEPYPPLELPLARAVRGEVVRNARWLIRRPDDSRVLAVGDAQPLRDAEGRQFGAVLTMRDDTARDDAERALRNLNATLAERVAERTREAEDAQAQAERASAAKSDFLAVMSHEIRTPLSSVIGYTELLAGLLPAGTDQAKYVERIASSGAALLTLVDDILNFSRVEAGQLELAPEPFAVAALIDNALSIVRPSAAAKALELACDADLPEDAFVHGDQNRLRQVLLNLLNNAIKFTRTGGVTLRLRRLQHPGADMRLRVEVCDTGVGVACDHQHRLFDRFFQVDSGGGRAHGGSGLGLAISKRLIELMGGEIGVSSQIGAGSTFWFEVTLAAADPPQASRLVVEPRAEAVARCVLLVDDMPINQSLAKLVLAGKGHEVDVASSGAEAIAAVQGRRYDVVLMDVQMPGMDGMEAARRIRQLEHACATTPIIAMTANVLPEQVAATRRAGMDGHLGKPFKAADLLAAVQSAARRAPAAPLPAEAKGGRAVG
ncbi:MAG: response regulator [Caulobacteraceae bacterium]|nr:response regulator [Caulobacter sp.]